VPPWRLKEERVYVVLPAYNEDDGLPALLEAIEQAMHDDGIPYEVIVVDDGSKDQTYAIAERYVSKMPLRIFRHEQNKGLGATVRDGLQIAAEHCGDRDIIVAMDADNTHLPGLIRRMTRRIHEGCDVVIASRYQPGAIVRGVPWHRRFLSFGARVLFQTIMPIRGVRDYTCGYRAYRGRVLRQAFQRYGDDFINQEGFQCMVDILLKLRKMDVIFGEVPLILRYDLKGGQSKMRIFRTVWKTLALLVRRRIRP
jgi:dolichol-phosphate mannosyltransferase